MIDIEKIKKEIVKRLKPHNLDKVILFGSYAWGEPTENSDIDLYVVTKDNFIPQSFKEKIEIKLKISRAVKDLQKAIPIDIITHTKKMEQKFIELNSMFCRDIIQNGVRLI